MSRYNKIYSYVLGYVQKQQVMLRFSMIYADIAGYVERQ